MILVLFTACSKDQHTTPVVKSRITGFAQKGPFLNGSSVTLSELDGDYSQTGKSYSTQILDNSGAFELKDVTLASQYAGIRTDGFYFNEVCGGISKSQITLNGLVDVAGETAININILTHLEKPRVEYLVSHGTAFADAKEQAQGEILRVFGITPAQEIKNSELLDISKNSEGDAILIAVSSLLQGYRSEGDFSELLANIATDLREDGKLDSKNTGANLLAHAKLLDTLQIKNNLAERYNDLGIAVNVPFFGKYISGFISESDFPDNYRVIEYPSSGAHGKNILDLNTAGYAHHTDYSFAARLPVSCLRLKIRISFISSPDTTAYWHYQVGSVKDWNVSEFNSEIISQEFTSSGKEPDLDIVFDRGTYLIEYFENNLSRPALKKTISIQ